MEDIGTRNLTIGPHATIVPFGFGVIVTGRSASFDDGIVGLMFKAIPDDLAEKAVVGAKLTDEDITRIQEVSDEAQTVFLHCKDPEALDNLADLATQLAAEWRIHKAENE